MNQPGVDEHGVGEQRLENVMRLLESMEWRAKLIGLATPFENLARHNVREGPPHERTSPTGPQDLLPRNAEEVIHQILVEEGIPVFRPDKHLRKQMWERLQDRPPCEAVIEAMRGDPCAGTKHLMCGLDLRTAFPQRGQNPGWNIAIFLFRTKIKTSSKTRRAPKCFQKRATVRMESIGFPARTASPSNRNADSRMPSGGRAIEAAINNRPGNGLA
jgi:hypothetical protein